MERQGKQTGCAGHGGGPGETAGTFTAETGLSQASQKASEEHTRLRGEELQYTLVIDFIRWGKSRRTELACYPKAQKRAMQGQSNQSLRGLL